jgi:hypothetical protein
MHAKTCGRAHKRTYRLAEGGGAHGGEGGGGAGEGNDNGGTGVHCLECKLVTNCFGGGVVQNKNDGWVVGLK